MNKTKITAKDIERALRHHFRDAAIITELVIGDDDEQFRDDGGERGPRYRRCDIFMSEKLQRSIIEIKVSAEDAKRETWEKVAPWRKVVHRYIYAVPAGLIETPPVYGCGLIWVSIDDYGRPRIEWKRKCSVNRYPEPLPQRVMENIMYRASRGEELLGSRSAHDLGY